MANSNPKTAKGRQKIEMKKIIKKSNLAVSFSKRRNGIFKKANELSTLCGAEVALVVFSPGENAYSFGHPNVDAVIDRYHMRPPPPNSSSTTIIDAYRNAKVRGLNTQITLINKEIEAEKKKSDYLNIERKELQKQFWIASSIEDMSSAQLDQYKLALENLKNSLDDSALAHNPHPQIFAGGSSSSNNPSLNNPHFFAGGVAFSNNPSLLQQPPCPLPAPQLFPIHPQVPHMLQNPSVMFPNHMFDGDMKMHHSTINNMGLLGPQSGFF